jgi:hypothetical protein
MGTMQRKKRVSREVAGAAKPTVGRFNEYVAAAKALAEFSALLAQLPPHMQAVVQCIRT